MNSPHTRNVIMEHSMKQFSFLSSGDKYSISKSIFLVSLLTSRTHASLTTVWTLVEWQQQHNALCCVVIVKNNELITLMFYICWYENCCEFITFKKQKCIKGLVPAFADFSCFIRAWKCVAHVKGRRLKMKVFWGRCWRDCLDLIYSEAWQPS
jgi:hypothetical protein